MSDQISFSSNRNTIQKFKVVLVGDQNVGKSSIIARYIRNEFDPTKNVHSIAISAYHRNRFNLQEHLRNWQNGSSPVVGHGGPRAIQKSHPELPQGCSFSHCGLRFDKYAPE